MRESKWPAYANDQNILQMSRIARVISDFGMRGRLVHDSGNGLIEKFESDVCKWGTHRTDIKWRPRVKLLWYRVGAASLIECQQRFHEHVEVDVQTLAYRSIRDLLMLSQPSRSLPCLRGMKVNQAKIVVQVELFR